MSSRHISIAEVEVLAKFFKIVGGIPLPPSPRLPSSWWLQKNLLNNHIIKISKGKYRYFKYDFNEKNNYAHNFDEKHILLWCDEKEVSDESSNTRQIKFINFKKRFAQFGRKITAYSDMLLMHINLPAHEVP